jgi:hypothetical protein
MKNIIKNDLSIISGSGKWSSESSDWGSLPYSPIPSTPTSVESDLDYGLMAILMGNAALFGCLNGARTAGIYGCIYGGSIAGVGTMYAMIFADTYKMYTDNKK